MSKILARPPPDSSSTRRDPLHRLTRLQAIQSWGIRTRNVEHGKVYFERIVFCLYVAGTGSSSEGDTKVT